MMPILIPYLLAQSETYRVIGLDKILKERAGTSPESIQKAMREGSKLTATETGQMFEVYHRILDAMPENLNDQKGWRKQLREIATQVGKHYWDAYTAST